MSAKNFSPFFIYYKSLLILGVLVICGCAKGPLGIQSGDSGSSNTSSASGLNNPFETQALSVLKNNCSSCHNLSSGPANVFDITNTQYLVSSRLIVPGDLAQSQIYFAITTNMPPGGALSPADQQLIANWILATTGSAAPPPPVGEPGTFRNLQATVFQPLCVSCHYKGSATAGYAYDSYAAVLRSVNVNRPTSSLVYTITESGEMPRNKPLLSADQLAQLLKWIQAGAQEN